MKTSSIFLSAGLCVASVTLPANAQLAPPQVVADVRVRYDDLDLESGPDIRTMLARLDLAATKACGGKPTPPMPGDQVGLAMQEEYRRCKAAAMESSTLRLGSWPVRAAWLNKWAPSTIKSPEAFKVAHDDTQLLTR